MVRPFPRTTRRATPRRLALVALVATSVALSVLVLPAAADNLHHRQKHVQHRIHLATADLDESSKLVRTSTHALLRARRELRQARHHLAHTKNQLAAARATDEKMRAALAVAVQRLQRAELDLEQGKAEVTDQQDRLRQIVVSAYDDGDPSLMGLTVVFSSQDPGQLTSNLHSNSTVVDKESAVLDRLQAAKVMLTVREQARQTARNDVAAKRRQAHQHLLRTKALTQQARLAKRQVVQLVGKRTQARRSALRGKRADLRSLHRLQRQRDRIDAMIHRRTATTRYRGPVHGGGYLSYPVNGPVTSPFGWRIHPIYGYRELHDGVDFGVACGTPIRAAAPGRVLSEYYQTAWGNRIFIAHGIHRGVGLVTIANHMSGYAVGVGAHVRRGQVVGYVGTTGWSTGCHLHFTVLQNGVAVNPMNWL